MGPKSNDSVLTRDRKGHEKTEEGDVKMETEIVGMWLQVKE